MEVKHNLSDGNRIKVEVWVEEFNNFIAVELPPMSNAKMAESADISNYLLHLVKARKQPH